MTGVEPNAMVAQIDARYTTGHCAFCTPVPKPRIKKGTGPGTGREAVWERSPRKTVQLVRADAWDPERLRYRREREHRVALASQLDTTRKARPMSDADREAAQQALTFQLEHD